MERAKKRIAEFHNGSAATTEDIQVKRAEFALQRAVARLRAAGSEFEN